MPQRNVTEATSIMLSITTCGRCTNLDFISTYSFSHRLELHLPAGDSDVCFSHVLLMALHYYWLRSCDLPHFTVLKKAIALGKNDGIQEQ